MKRLVKLLFTLIVLVVCSCSLFACQNPNTNGDTGLIVKQISGKQTYTIEKYIDDGRDSTVLDIKAEEEALSQKLGENVVITSISKNAFSGVKTLKEVIVPATVENISAGAFANMYNLRKLTLPFIGINATGDTYYSETGKVTGKAVNENRTFGVIFGTSEYDGGAMITQNFLESVESSETEGNTVKTSIDYYFPMTLKEVTIAPKDVEGGYGIPMFAFSGNKFLTKITFAENANIRAIGDYAFSDCNSLKTIEVPSTVKVIGKNAFYSCTSLITGKVVDGQKIGFSFADNSTLRLIKEGAFRGVGIKELTIPSSVESIGNYCFTSVLYNESTDILEETKLEKIIFAGENTTIGSYAFYQCINLKEITLPKNLKEIGSYTFAYCKKLSTINFDGDFSKVQKGANWNLEAHANLI